MKPSEDERIDYRRGRSGRPIGRIRAALKREGAHICVHCGKAIDMSLHHTDRWSWTLEHLVPLDVAPELWAEPSNHAEAHRTCNSSRGKRELTPQIKGSRRW